MRTHIRLSFLLPAYCLLALPTQDTKEWQAPARAARKKNPITMSKASVEAGKKSFRTLCVACHGAKGKGDGPAAVALKPRPRDLTSGVLGKQADGELFWKIRNGKAPMPAFGTALTKEQTWHVVNYVRSLGPTPAKPDAPKVEVTPPTFKAPAGLKQAISGVTMSYAAVGDALASDDLQQAVKAWAKLTKTASDLGAAGSRTLKGKARAEWLVLNKQLVAATKTLGNVKDLDTVRKRFRDTTAVVVRLVTGFGHGDARPLSVFHCPKAFEGAGAEWVQHHRSHGNPYLGKKAKCCMQLTKILGASAPEGGV